MSDFLAKFRLPVPTLKQLTFCEPDLESVADWLHRQQLDQGAHMSLLLYKMLPEINLLQTSTAERLQMLDLLRPRVYECVQGLTQEYLQKPLHAPGKTLQFGSITLALLRHLADGYLLCFGQHRESGGSAKVMATSLYLAVQTMGYLFFQHCRLYTPPQLMFWYKAHQCYALALEHGLSDEAVEDTQLEGERFSSIQTAYYRLVMLATGNTNQLDLGDINHLYQTLEQWYVLGLPSLRQEGKLSIWVNPELDMPPCCREPESMADNKGEDSGAGQSHEEGQCWHFDLSQTVELLLTHNAHRPGEGVAELPTYFRHSLGEHLINCWRSPHQRQHPRTACDELFEISLGLQNACRLLAGTSGQADEGNSVSLVSVVDSSESGYCLRWHGNAPESLVPGECLLLREVGKSRWKTLVVRWAQRINQYVYAGIHLVCENASAASLSSRSLAASDAEPLPAILLTQSQSGALPESGASLILPSDTPEGEWCIRMHPSGQRLDDSGREENVRLTGCISRFGVVSQFHCEYPPVQ